MIAVGEKLAIKDLNLSSIPLPSQEESQKIVPFLSPKEPFVQEASFSAASLQPAENALGKQKKKVNRFGRNNMKQKETYIPFMQQLSAAQKKAFRAKMRKIRRKSNKKE